MNEYSLLKVMVAILRTAVQEILGQNYWIAMRHLLDSDDVFIR